MLRNCTIYYTADKNGDMTKSQNVKSSQLSPTRNCKEETSGVATQKALKRDEKKVKILVNVLYDLLKIYGYDDKRVKTKLNLESDRSVQIEANRAKTVRDKEKLKELYLQFWKEAGIGSWKDLFKYKINAFFSFVMKQEIPPAPKGLDAFPALLDPSFLFFGRAKRYLSKIKLNRDKLESFAQSVAQSKKGAPPVARSMVEEAEQKCFEHLTTSRDDIPDFVWNDGVFEHHINRFTACYQLRRTVRELFQGLMPTWKEVTRPFVPSTNSQYNYSRNDCGGVGAFKEGDIEFLGFIGRTYQDYCTLSGQDSLVKKSLTSVKLGSELTELYGSAGIRDQERIDQDLENVLIKDTLGLEYDGSFLKKAWSDKIYPRMIFEAMKEEPKTMVIGLPEPLKVRCITAGPPITYAVLKPLQKWLWRNLKIHKVFNLIGTPVTDSIVRDSLGKLGFDEEFISGDYKASTDNLHSWVSECLLDSLDEVWTEQINLGCNDPFVVYKDNIVTLMKRALTGHIIMDPACNEMFRKGVEIRDSDFRQQKEGQLMGSIISFPFLCLANAALCRWAMEISEGKNLRLTNRPIHGYTKCRLLVNGDDCVFPGKKEKAFEAWKKITAFGGLESSVGKTFRSDSFLTINSVQYQYDLEKPYVEDDDIEEPTYKDIKYVNLGLVYCQKKDGIRGKPFYRLGAVHRDLYKTCPEKYFKRATKLFMKECSQKRFRTTYTNVDGKTVKVKIEDFFANIKNSRVPYYMPEWLGGLGLVRTEKDQVNDWDLRVASVIRSGQGLIEKISEDSEWQFHKLVSKELEDYRFLDNQNFLNIKCNGEIRSVESQYRELYTLIVVDCLLKYPLHYLVGEIEDQEHGLRRAWISNKVVWENLRSNPKLSGLVYSRDPAVYSDLLQERKEFYLSCFNGEDPETSVDE